MVWPYLGFKRSAVRIRPPDKQDPGQRCCSLFGTIAQTLFATQCYGYSGRMTALIFSLLARLEADERGEVSWKWLALGMLIGAGLVVLLAVFGLIKFLIPGE
jgi:hypothetical protein